MLLHFFDNFVLLLQGHAFRLRLFALLRHAECGLLQPIATPVRSNSGRFLGET